MNSLPNPRVQRTRSSPSARHEPLTRHPLGRRIIADESAAVTLPSKPHRAREA